ncbi:MAG: protein arginine kinase [Gemmatimonadota bacterium]
MNDFASIPDHGLGWLQADGEHADIVLSTRVRIARNLQGHAFGPRARVNDREAVLREFKRSSTRCDALKEGALLEIPELPERTRRILHERRLVTQDLLGPEGDDPANGTAVHFSGRDPVSVMINEEDHLRVQSLVSGLRIRDAWNLVDRLDEELGRELPYAYHHDFGFLTSCPTNVGSGLRASVFMHLNGLVLTQEIGKALKALSELGLTFRGLYGEGSEVVGSFFQISNQTTLGRTEEDLIDDLERVARKLIADERKARHFLLQSARAETEDKIWRAYGELRYARLLSGTELIGLLAPLRMGISLKLLPGLSVYSLNKMMVFTQPAHLEQAAGCELSSEESDAHRASYVRRVLATEGVVADSDDHASEQP